MPSLQSQRRYEGAPSPRAGKDKHVLGGIRECEKCTFRQSVSRRHRRSPSCGSFFIGTCKAAWPRSSISRRPERMSLRINDSNAILILMRRGS